MLLRPKFVVDDNVIISLFICESDVKTDICKM